MTATIHQLPSRYRIAWSDGDRSGIVEDQATGRDWDTRQEWEAENTMQQLAQQYTGIIFWITRGVE